MRRLGLKKKTPTPEENAKISDSKKAKKPCSSVTNADAFPDYARRRKKRCATKDIEPLLKDVLEGKDIKEVSFYRAKWKERTVELLFKALSATKKLIYLDLEGCDLGSNIISQLAGLLSRNKSLQAVDLRHNRINENCLNEIIAAVKCSYNLCQVLADEGPSGELSLGLGEASSSLTLPKDKLEVLRKTCRGNRAIRDFKLGKTRQLDMQHRNICVLYGVLPKPGSYCKKLNISHNDIISIPPSLLLKWNRICSLRLNYNNMTFLPDTFYALKELRVLEVHHNNLSCLPNSLSQCKHLTELRLHNNRISHVPVFLGGLSALEVLTFADNPVDNVPVEYIASSTGKDQTLLMYLRSEYLKNAAKIALQTEEEVKKSKECPRIAMGDAEKEADFPDEMEEMLDAEGNPLSEAYTSKSPIGSPDGSPGASPGLTSLASPADSPMGSPLGTPSGSSSPAGSPRHSLDDKAAADLENVAEVLEKRAESSWQKARTTPTDTKRSKRSLMGSHDAIELDRHF